jgi:hypothetical protein
MDLNEKIQIETEFANAAYKNFISKRYGLTPCCLSDLQSITIKRDACNWEELQNKELVRTEGLVSQEINCEELE